MCCDLGHRRVCGHGSLHRERRYVATLVPDEVGLAIHEEVLPVFILTAQVAGVVPERAEGLQRRLGVSEVAVEDDEGLGGPDTELADLAPWNRQVLIVEELHLDPVLRLSEAVGLPALSG